MTDGMIAIVGLFDPEYPAHAATHRALIHAQNKLGVVMNTKWVTPTQIVDRDDVFDGTCCALIAPRNPKSPRQLWPEILASLEWFEARNIPVLGMEYGFQHMVIDHARRRLGQETANSTAYDEKTDFPVISRLESDQPPIDKFRPKDVDFIFEDGSRMAEIYATNGPVTEAFRGHYVVNPDFAAEFEAAGIRFSGCGHYGQRKFIAALEWDKMPFHCGVAFLPQYRSSDESPHPLIEAFVRAGVAYCADR